MNLKLILILFSVAVVMLSWGGQAIAGSEATRSQTAQSPATPANPGLVAQCDNLIAVANQVVDSVNQVSQAPSSDPVKDVLQMADIVDRASTEMQALSLTDTELLSFRANFITMYAGTSRAARALADAASQDDAAAAEQAFTDLETATAAEDQLIPALNTYCERTAQAVRAD